MAAEVSCMMIERTSYLQALQAWQGEKVIKVITGLRRCGKSTLLEQFQGRLLREGIHPDQIIAINLKPWKMKTCWNTTPYITI